jgi:site-specific recombinase XerD
MGLADFFVCDRTMERFRQPPLGPQLDPFCDWLAEGGFCWDTVRGHVTHISHLNRFLCALEIDDASQLDQATVESFLAEHRPGQRCLCGRGVSHAGLRWSVHRFVQFLTGIGLLEFNPWLTRPYGVVLEQFLRWLEVYQNSAPGTIELRRQYLVQFLDWLGASAVPTRLATLTSERVRAFYLEYCRNRGRSARRSMQATLRMFLRFCLAERYTTHELAAAVPTLRTYRLARLPRGIEDAAACQVLAGIDRTTPVGKRDYVIIQLLHSYGVRGGHIRALRLDDIDWAQSRIRFRAMKHGKPIAQPLLPDVGEALLDYIRNGRPHAPCAEVFLTCRAPYHPFEYSSSLSAITERRMRAAGVSAPTFGAHAFRHCFASRMVNAGESIKAVADMIGHRSLSTTFIYTKVDFRTLSEVPLEWPGTEVVR